MKSGQFWPCYSQKCKNRKLLRRVTNFFQIFTKLWKFLSYSLFDYRKIVKSWLFGRAIQKPEVHLFNFFYFFTYELLLAIWVFFRCFNLFFQSMTMQKLFLKKKWKPYLYCNARAKMVETGSSSDFLLSMMLFSSFFPFPFSL